MSGHNACTCAGPRSERIKNWFVVTRNSRCSAFDGYHVKWSPYSAVTCNGDGGERRQHSGCLGLWRSKSAYVDGLPDGEIKVRGVKS